MRVCASPTDPHLPIEAPDSKMVSFYLSFIYIQNSNICRTSHNFGIACIVDNTEAP